MISYKELGIRPIINAAATLTRLGGSRMPQPVLDAMAAGAQAFVDLPELQARVGARIAQVTRNQACYVSCGAAAGIVLATAACITGDDPLAIAGFPRLDERKHEVIVHRSQRNNYDYAIRQTGARMIEIGTREATQRSDLEAAITPRTACVVFFAGEHLAPGAIPLPEVIEIAHTHGVPVIVDAAAQIPPISNLWRFTVELGADLVLFSGGKGLRGPQPSGLILGRADLIEACRANGSPNTSIGRPMKVGKEELLGILAAVEWSLAQDEPAQIAAYEAMVRYWIAGLEGIKGVSATRGYPNEAGQPFGRAIVQIGPEAGVSRDQVVAALMAGDPAIAAGTIGPDCIALNPQTVEPGEETLVLQALRRVLGVNN